MTKNWWKSNVHDCERIPGIVIDRNEPAIRRFFLSLSTLINPSFLRIEEMFAILGDNES